MPSMLPILQQQYALHAQSLPFVAAAAAAAADDVIFLSLDLEPQMRLTCLICSVLMLCLPAKG